MSADAGVLVGGRIGVDDVSTSSVVRARQVLHAVAEHLLAGPQHRRTGEIALAVTEGGFAPTHPVADGVDRLEVTAPRRPPPSPGR